MVIGLVVVSMGCFPLESPGPSLVAQLSEERLGDRVTTLGDGAVVVVGGMREDVLGLWCQCRMATVGCSCSTDAGMSMMGRYLWKMESCKQLESVAADTVGYAS